MDELVITNGAMEALNLGLQCVTQPGDLVAIEAPAFYATLQVLERLKLRAVEIPVHPREGVDLEVLEKSLDTLPIKACWFMSHLQNPLGASLNDARKAQLYALLSRHQLPMLERASPMMVFISAAVRWTGWRRSLFSAVWHCYSPMPCSAAPG